MITTALDNAKCKYMNFHAVFVANGVTQFRFAISSVDGILTVNPEQVCHLKVWNIIWVNRKRLIKTDHRDGIRITSPKFRLLQRSYNAPFITLSTCYWLPQFFTIIFYFQKQCFLRIICCKWELWLMRCNSHRNGTF